MYNDIPIKTFSLNNSSYTQVDSSGVNIQSNGSYIHITPSNIDASGLTITSSTPLSIGNTGIDSSLIGNVVIPNSLTVGGYPYPSIKLYGGSDIDSYDNTTVNNIQTRLGSNEQNQTYTAIITNTSATGTLVLPNVKNYYRVNIINNSLHDWFITPQVGEYIVQSLAGSGITNPNTITIRSYQTFGFYQLEDTGKYNLLTSECINGTVGSFPSIQCPSYDVGTSSSLNIGTSVANGVNIGRNGQSTDLRGNLKVNGSTGTNGQVLTSNGTSSSFKSVRINTTQNISYLTTGGLLNATNVFNPQTITPSSVSIQYRLYGSMVVSSISSIVNFGFARQAGPTIDVNSTAINIFDSSNITPTSIMTISNCMAQVTTTNNEFQTITWEYLYVPATTSQTTFALYVTTGGNAMRYLCYFNIMQINPLS